MHRLSQLVAVAILTTMLLTGFTNQTIRTPQADHREIVIPFTLTASNNIVVKTILNDTDALNLMLHTAARDVTLTEDATRKAKSIKFTNTDKVKSWGGEADSRFSKGNRVQIGDLTLADTFSWLRGSHTLKFGGEYRRICIFREAQRFRRGNFTFSGVYTSEKPNDAASRASSGNGLADFLLGNVANGTYDRAQGEDLNAPYYGAFVQDDWKVTQNITLNLGLRWEATRGAFYPNPDKQTVGRYWLPEFYGTGQAEGIYFPTSANDCGCKNDLMNFAPRLGIAWKLNEKTVIRAGAGIFYAQPDGFDSQFSNFFTGPPKANELTFAANNTVPVASLRNGFPDLPA